MQVVNLESQLTWDCKLIKHRWKNTNISWDRKLSKDGWKKFLFVTTGIGQSANGTCQFGQTERAAHDQKVHPQRTMSVWPDTALSPGELTHVICELADLYGQLCMTHRNALILVHCLSQLTWILNIFSNSLIIHKEKTKEITTENEIWICDPNYLKIR